MDDKRVGRQLPTSSLVLPYSETKGPEAVGLYDQSGRTAQEWQSIQIYDMMAVNEDGLWVHMKYGYSVPRRNGKSEILIIRAMYGLMHGERASTKTFLQFTARTLAFWVGKCYNIR